jgi:signal transduction histidine kinase
MKIKGISIPRGNRTLIVLFLAGIVLPSMILSVLSFRSIRNEVLLAERAYEEDVASLRKAAEAQVNKELQSIFSDVKKRSSWLYDQPRSVDDLTKAPPLDTILGVQSIFLFRGEQRVFPLYIPQKQSSATFPAYTPDHAGTATLKGLELLRTLYKTGRYRDALLLINAMELRTGSQGILHSSLQEPLQLMRFRILVQTGDRQNAIHYSLDLVTSFLQNPGKQDIEATMFVFESMFATILSFEELPSDKRELFWNLRRNLTFQMVSSLAWDKHSSLLEHLLTSQYQPENGIVFLEENGEWGFRMAHPWLPGDQTVLGVFDQQSLRNRLLKPFQSSQREWRQVCYRLTDSRDSVLSQRLPRDTLIVLSSQTLLDDFPGWTLTVFQRDLREIRKESRNKMFLLYSLVGFALLVLILGTVFVAKGITQERNLLTMKANFLSSISHELKTPLTSIRMFSEMMAQGRVQKIEKVIEYSGLIGKEANRLDSLIQAILSYTRMERGDKVFRWEALDLGDCVSKVLESLKPIAVNRGLEWAEDLTPGLLVQGDFTALYSLIQNLVDNAIKYTPPPGTITVEVLAEDGAAVFQVTDTGVGIPATEQKNIFDDFYRVGDEMTRSTKGSGLGLAIVRKVAETHRASIAVHSRPGKGSTFTVRFKRIAK